MKGINPEERPKDGSSDSDAFRQTPHQGDRSREKGLLGGMNAEQGAGGEDVSPTRSSTGRLSGDGGGEEDYSHDAGYDSMMTSIVFLLQLAHILPRHGLRWQDLYFRYNEKEGQHRQ